MDPTKWSTKQKIIATTATTVLVGSALAYRASLPIPGPAIPEQQSLILPREREGESEILRSTFASDRLIHKRYEDVSTLWDNFSRGVRISRDKNCLGWRNIEGGPYKWMTYADVLSDAKAIGSGLQNSLGLEPGDFVGIYAKNRKEWTITEQACNGYSMVLVPLYDTLGSNAVKYICTQSELKIIFCSGDSLEQLIQSIRSGIEHLKYIVCFDEIDEEQQELVNKEFGINILTYSELLSMGKTTPKDPIPPKADDLATICYTSGTTGDPKGVKLTHANLIASATAVITLDSSLFQYFDVHISYLPLAHMFERITQITMLGVGASIGFFRGDVKKHLFDDIATLRPTIFPSVPRLFNRLYDVIWGKCQELTGLKKIMFERAWAAKKEALKNGSVKHPLWDTLVFNKIAQRLGGRVRVMVTGSAPINGDVIDFLRIAFSCVVLEGYGQTETGAGVSATLHGDTTTGHVGPPLCCNDVKLVDVPEMEYTTANKIDGVLYPQGELCFRGANITSGYYKMPEKTRETIDEDGWLHSGDIGQINPNGTIKIIDRKKNIFKLAHGEYVAPEKIENIIVKSPFVAQVFIHGESLRAYLVGIIVPDEEVVKHWAKDNGMDDLSFEELCANSKLKQAILESTQNLCTEEKLPSYEKPRDIALVSELFSVDNEILTPTFKLKRPQARKKYGDLIEEMYAED